MKFIDIHNHIVSNVDDGAKTEKQTIQMLKSAEKDHIEKLVITPHYKENVFENTKVIIQEKLKELKLLIEENHINIEVYPGSEIFLSKNTSSLLSTHQIQTLNDSNYILVETHRFASAMLLNLKEELYNLSIDGYKVILAHPERYEFTHNHINDIYNLVSEGHLMQVNVNCLNTSHPNYKIVKKLLDNNLIHFIASDAHDPIQRPLQLAFGYEFIKKHYGMPKADDLFYNHPLQVIESKLIEVKDFYPVKDKKFFLF